MRPARLWALARQDWAVELGGRQGWMIPGLLVTLLAGPAAAPSFSLPAAGWRAEGDVPDAVLTLPQRPDGVPLPFRREGERLVVVGDPPPEVRAALDGAAPTVRREKVGSGPRLPGRTVSFALISASTLSGAVATSLGGERQRRTLGVLLSAAVSRAEVVAGKALAWTLLGLVSVEGAALVAVALGRVPAGWWLVPLCTLPLSTVALGFWLVRKATDVMSGTATSMRVLPAAVSIAGLVAFVFGAANPWLGALLPIGGAVIAAGDTWEGAGPPLLAAASNLAFSLGALALTWRDLEETPSEEPPAAAPLRALLVAGFAGTCWWLATCTPLLYAYAGNATVVERVPLSRGVAAGAACLLAGTVLHLARTPGATVPIGVDRSRLAAWLGVIPAVAASWLAHHALLAPLRWPGLAERMREAAAFGGPVGGFAVVCDELLFRGWLPAWVGPGWAILAAVLVKAPLDPWGALVEAVTLTLLARATGSVWPGVLARWTALLVL